MDVLTQAQNFLGQAISHQVMQFGIAFGFAALVHAKQVRKEIRLQMSSMTESMVGSIDAVAKALKDDLGKQGERLSNVEVGVQKLNTRVEKLEKEK